MFRNEICIGLSTKPSTVTRNARACEQRTTVRSKPRQWFLSWEVEFRELYVEAVPGASIELSKPLNQLSRGEAYRFRGFELPEDYPARLIFGINADLVLTADHVVMPYNDFRESRNQWNPGVSPGAKRVLR